MPASLDAADKIDLDDFASLIQKYREAKDAIASWEERADELKHELVSAMGTAKAGYVGGALVVRRAHVERERLDKAGLLRAYPDARRFYVPGAVYDMLTFPSSPEASAE